MSITEILFIVVLFQLSALIPVLTVKLIQWAVNAREKVERQHEKLPAVPWWVDRTWLNR